MQILITGVGQVSRILSYNVVNNDKVIHQIPNFLLIFLPLNLVKILV